MCLGVCASMHVCVQVAHQDVAQIKPQTRRVTQCGRPLSAVTSAATSPHSLLCVCASTHVCILSAIYTTRTHNDACGRPLSAVISAATSPHSLLCVCASTHVCISATYTTRTQGDAMWTSIERGDFSRYKSTLSALRVKPSSRQGSTPAIPMRVFAMPSDTIKGEGFSPAIHSFIQTQSKVKVLPLPFPSACLQCLRTQSKVKVGAGVHASCTSALSKDVRLGCTQVFNCVMNYNL